MRDWLPSVTPGLGRISLRGTVDIPEWLLSVRRKCRSSRWERKRQLPDSWVSWSVTRIPSWRLLTCRKERLLSRTSTEEYSRGGATWQAPAPKYKSYGSGEETRPDQHRLQNSFSGAQWCHARLWWRWKCVSGRKGGWVQGSIQVREIKYWNNLEYFIFTTDDWFPFALHQVDNHEWLPTFWLQAFPMTSGRALVETTRLISVLVSGM